MTPTNNTPPTQPDAQQPTDEGLDDAICWACGQKPRRKVDYGDFSEYEVRCLVAEYCMSVTIGCTGWGVSFKTWVELRGIAKHDGMFRLIRLANVDVEARREIENMERQRDQYAAMLCEAMRVVYATTCHGDSTDLIDRFEALELTPAISSENA